MNTLAAARSVISTAVSSTMTAQQTDTVPLFDFQYVRVSAIAHCPVSTGNTRARYTAVVCHEQLPGKTLTVTWVAQAPKAAITTWTLVRIIWNGHRRIVNGVVEIKRLERAPEADGVTNLFLTVPDHPYCANRALIGEAASLFAKLPRELAQLHNHLLWDCDRFRRFVIGPSSLSDHHNIWQGNLEHSVQVALIAVSIGEAMIDVDVPLLIFGGLVHDLAKCAEYHFSKSLERFVLSDRGKLVGHRDTLIEWLAIAKNMMRTKLSEHQELTLHHMLFSSYDARDSEGLRRKRTKESKILAAADSMSGQCNLHQQYDPKTGLSGFGRYREKWGHAPFYLPRESWGESANDPLFDPITRSAP